MKKAATVCLSLILVLLFTVSTAAKVIFVYGDWTLQSAIQEDDFFAVDGYTGSETDIVVPESFGGYQIIEICSFAFMNNESISSITVGQNIVTICHDAFINATGLTKVVLSSSVTAIEEDTFFGTANLKDINLEVTEIEEIAAETFCKSGITAITLPSSCQKIGVRAFDNCDSLTKIVIPATVTEIGEDAFRNSEQVVIHAPYGSYAIEYAAEHGIGYVYSDLEAYTFVRGDADGDGDITIMDATRVQRVLAHFDDDVDGTIAIRAAMDEDRVLGIMDATRIQRQLAQFDDPYGIGKEVTVYLLPDGSIFEPDKINA